MCQRTGHTKCQLCVIAAVVSVEHGDLMVEAIEAHRVMAVQPERIAETG